MGRKLAQWTTNQHRFVLRVVNESGQGKWATFCKKTDTWTNLDPGQARDRIKEYNEETPSPPPFDPALVNTSKHTWRVDDASDACSAAAMRASDTAADGHMRGPSPSHRQRPTVVNTVYELKAVRRTAVDCERQTTDEVVQGARRKATPYR